MSSEKLKTGVFDGPQIRKIMRDPGFVKSMTVVKSAAWISFSLVVKNFLGNTKADNYKELVEDMLLNFQNLSIKVHYLFCHLDRFPENFGDLSKSEGKDSIRALRLRKKDTKEGGIPI